MPMPGYLVTIYDQRKIVFSIESVINKTANSFKLLTECSDLELKGIQAFHKDEYIANWPAESELLNQALINAISAQIKIDNSTELKNTIQEAINSSNLSDRCPFTSFPINKSRNLGITVIQHYYSCDYEHGESGEDREDVRRYYENPSIVYQLMPNSSLPFALVNHEQASLSISEELDYQSYNDVFPYLKSAIDFKNNLINPYLEIIKLLHSKQLTHGDITSSNVVLSLKFNKLIFVDFKHIGEVSCDNSLVWHSKRLEDLHHMAGSILYRLPANDYQNNPAMIYLSTLTDRLEDFEDDDVIEANKDLTIETVISCINRFWSLIVPSELVHLATDELSPHQEEVLHHAYINACKEKNLDLMSFCEELYPQCRINISCLGFNAIAPNSKRKFSEMASGSDLGSPVTYGTLSGPNGFFGVANGPSHQGKCHGGVMKKNLI